jgi:ankyrin repeat protein
MIGNDQVRFCEHCNLHVNNLSAMTRQEAMRFVAKSRGRLCVRYERRSTGEILTKHFPQPLYRIGRRASRIAASAFSATLSFSGAVAQIPSSSPRPAEVVREAAQTLAKSGADAKLSGTIKDPADAVIPGATLTLTNDQTSAERSATSSDEGSYVFDNLTSGTYTLKIEVNGFKTAILKEIQIHSAASIQADVPLEVAGESVTVGIVAIAEPSDPLPRAAHKDEMVTVIELARLTSDIDAPDQSTDISALAYAIENHNRDMVHVLLTAGADINAANKYGRTPIMYLGDGATTELVRDLIAAGANVEVADQNGESVMMNATRSCSLAVVQQLFAAGAHLDAKDDNGTTVLMNAAQNGDAAVLKLLLSAGVDATAKNEDGETALSLAARWGRSQSMKALLDAGATFDLKQEQLDELLLQAVQGEDAGTVRILLQAGANVDAKEGDVTALMRAAERERPEAVKLLIDAGAGLNARDDDGWTALMYANDVESVRLLINAGADTSAKSKDGKTALALAIENKQDDIAKLLKSHDAPE